jgi:hypothetical protein
VILLGVRGYPLKYALVQCPLENESGSETESETEEKQPEMDKKEASPEDAVVASVDDDDDEFLTATQGTGTPDGEKWD